MDTVATAKLGTLSRREREIALAYAEGASHREIGARLFIAPSTVRTHLSTIYQKLDVSSKIALRRVVTEQPFVPPAPESRSPTHRATVAIMPLRTAATGQDTIAAGLVSDIITRLAKLRSVRVMGRGSVFALRERGVADEAAGRLLEADYLATGSLDRRQGRMTVTMELIRTASGQIVWADSFDHKLKDTLAALATIGDQITASIASEIETAERNRAVLKNPESLDAWESFHRGLWHMYRFTRTDNDAAQGLFRRAVALDPTFSRAHAGLSFTHFQNAFLLRPADREGEVARALDAAGESLAADERDPAAYWAMGRALWLRGADADAATAIETSITLSPSFTPGHYSLAFVTSQSGDARSAVASADTSRRLSPFDPLLFGMLGARAMALFRLGDHQAAATSALEAAARPNAHLHIQAIAALCLAAAGRTDEARTHAATIQRTMPGYTTNDFFTAFRFPQETRAAFRQAAKLIGMA